MEGGVDLESEFAINPPKFMGQLRKKVIGMGVELVAGSPLEIRKTSENSAQIMIENREPGPFDKIIVSAGAWTTPLCHKLGYDPKILPASGLALIFDTKEKTIVSCPMILEDYGVSMSQHDESILRVTSFFQMVGFKKSYGPSRRKWLYDVVRKHVADLSSLEAREEGIGFRPCTPDQFPVIG